MSEKLADITVKKHHQTEKAILVSLDGDETKAKWVPLSQIEINSENDGLLEITLPRWLAEDKELV